MRKRMFLALALSMLVVLAFSYLQAPDNPDKLTKNKEQATSQERKASPDDSNGESQPAATVAESEPREESRRDASVSDTNPITATSTTSETVPLGDTVPFELAGLKGYFSRKGASLSSIKTLAYSRIDHPSVLYDMVYRNGEGLRTALQFDNPVLEQIPFELLDSKDTSTFRFRAQLDNGLRIEKTYDFNTSENYRMNLTLNLRNTSGEPLSLDQLAFPSGNDELGFSMRWGPGFGEGREQKTQFDKVYWYYGKNNEMQYMAPQGAGGFYSVLPFMGEDSSNKRYKYVEGRVDW